MENKIWVETVKLDHGREDSDSDCGKVGKLAHRNDRSLPESKSKTVSKIYNPPSTSSLKVINKQMFRSCEKEYFLLSSCDVPNWIPKQLVTVDEKYLRQCLQLISSNVMSGSYCKISLNVSWRGSEQLAHSVSPLCLDSHFLSETGNFAVSASGRWAVGAIMESQSMKNIMKSPILHQCPIVDNDLKSLSLNEVDGSVGHSFASSPSQDFNRSLQKQSTTMRRRDVDYETSCQQKSSISSSNLSGPLASSVSKRGMLQCIWKDGDPHFVFSLDDRNLVFSANMERSNHLGGSASDCVYLFYLETAGHRGFGVQDDVARLVGKMIVSASLTICSDHSRILEREFVLFGGSETYLGEMGNSNRDTFKNKGFLKKVPGVFNISHSIRKRTNSRLSGSNTFPENCPWEPTPTGNSDATPLRAVNLTENNVPSNYELAAVVVRDHFACVKEIVGGWGLKFLKNAKSTESSDSSVSVPSAYSQYSTHCSTDVHVIVPAGYHGGPRNINGGPSTLTERWRSGGLCDCGGWDLGCPLTILKDRSNTEELSCSPNGQGDSKVIELLAEGSEDTVPSLRMANVQDGQYLVDYQSNLSPLQVFSVVVAKIHAQSSTLRPKMYSM